LKIKQIHLTALLDRQFNWLTKMLWANLKAEGLGVVSVEMQTTRPALFERLQPGAVLTAQGVRLRVRYVYTHPADIHVPASVSRVRIEFDRLDQVERQHRTDVVHSFTFHFLTR
jgi:hypothetical protein